MENNELVFLGLLYNAEEETVLIQNSRTGLQGAANNFQWALVRGLDEVLGKTINIVSSLPVGPYPQYYKKCFMKTICDNRQEARYIQIGFINLPVIKQLIRKRKIYEFFRKKITNHNKIGIICYSLYDPYVEALYRLKKKYPENINVCMIVPDMPGKYGARPSKAFDRFFFNIRGKRLLNICHSFDWYVLLTEQMKYPLNILDKPYIVIEGISDSSNIIQSDNTEKNEKIILFTGTLHRKFGIKRLLDAFRLIEGNEYSLVICGSGDMEDYIKKIEKEDQRVTYMGYVSKQKVLELQSNCTLLVNPRIEEEEFVKYSFPSKTMEYLLSGKPVIMNRLSGVPDEYYKYIIQPKDDSTVALADALKEVCTLPPEDRKRIGDLGREFILKNKTAAIQAKKVLELMEK